MLGVAWMNVCGALGSAHSTWLCTIHNLATNIGGYRFVVLSLFRKIIDGMDIWFPFLPDPHLRFFFCCYSELFLSSTILRDAEIFNTPMFHSSGSSRARATFQNVKVGVKVGLTARDLPRRPASLGVLLLQSQRGAWEMGSLTSVFCYAVRSCTSWFLHYSNFYTNCAKIQLAPSLSCFLQIFFFLHTRSVLSVSRVPFSLC